MMECVQVSRFHLLMALRTVQLNPHKVTAFIFINKLSYLLLTINNSCREYVHAPASIKIDKWYTVMPDCWQTVLHFSNFQAGMGWLGGRGQETFFSMVQVIQNHFSAVSITTKSPVYLRPLWPGVVHLCHGLNMSLSKPFLTGLGNDLTISSISSSLDRSFLSPLALQIF